MTAALAAFARGLHFRFLILVAGMAAALLAAQLLTETAIEFRKAREQRIAEALAATGTIARSLEQRFDRIEADEIEEILGSLRARPDVVGITVVDRDLTYQLDGDPKTSPFAAFRHSDVQLRSLKSGQTEHELSPDGIEIGEPLLSNGQPAGSVAIQFRNPGLGETLLPIVSTKLTAMLPILVTGLLFAAGFASQITAPLRRLAGAARALADGNLDQKIEVAGVLEIRQLGEAFATMIARLKANIEQIYQLAYVDRITQLPNREYFRMEMTRSIGNAARRGASGALLFVDLDGFKRVNDTHGHELGDRLLTGFAERIARVLRAGDTVSIIHPGDNGQAPGMGQTPGISGTSKDKQVLARLGGDEFTILLSEIREETDAAAVARRIIAAMERPFDISGAEVRLSASVGIATFPRDGSDYQTVLKCADMAMYQAKKEGKNTYRFYSEELNEQVSNRMRVETDLRVALEREELELYYQPKIDCRTGSVKGVEALVRWNHPVRGIVNPGDFISVAEETGLILPLGNWVLARACRQALRFQGAGLDLTVAVNISMQQFERADFASDALSIVQNSGADARGIELEVTESMAMKDPGLTLRHFQKLKSAGIRFAIDDFGTGYSNLSQLSRLPFDVFKIDRSLVEALDGNKDGHGKIIVRSILALAKSLKYETVAEGVETREQHDFLSAEGCTHAQGFYFCKPMPAGDLESWFLTGAKFAPAMRKSAKAQKRA